MRITHYLYVQDESQANETSATLAEIGFTAECRRAADDLNWLVLAWKERPGEEEMQRDRVLLEAIAEQYSGEYDGWETEL